MMEIDSNVKIGNVLFLRWYIKNYLTCMLKGDFEIVFLGTIRNGLKDNAFEIEYTEVT